MKEKIHLTRDSVRQVTAEELPYIQGGISVDAPQKRKTKRKA